MRSTTPGRLVPLAVVLVLIGAVLGGIAVGVADLLPARESVSGVFVGQGAAAVRPGTYDWVRSPDDGAAVVTDSGQVVPFVFGTAAEPAGTPVVVEVSTLTRHPVAVRNVYRRIGLHDESVFLLVGGILLLLLLPYALGAAVGRAWPHLGENDHGVPVDPLPGRPRRILLGGCAVLAVLAAGGTPTWVGLARLGAVRDTGVTLTSDAYPPISAADYAWRAPRSQPVTVAGFSLRVTGEPRPGLPPGAAPRLRDLHVLAVPLEVGHPGPPGDQIGLALAGRGRGHAELIPAAACAPPGTGFDGTWTTGPHPTARLACFAVPADFTPDHLLLRPPDHPPAVSTGIAIQL